MTTTADVVIIGGGVEGIACALSLAERGETSVIVFERGGVAEGGTGRSSGIVRAHYGIPSLAAMARIGADYLASAPDRLGDDIGYHEVGYVVGVAPDDVPALQANLAMQRGVGVDTHEISRDEVAELFPFAHLDDFGAFGYEAAAGFGDPARTCLAMAARARTLGVTIRQQTLVTTVARSAGGGWVIETAHDRYEAETLIVAAGVHTARLAAPLGITIPLRPQREQLLVVEPHRHLAPLPVLSDLVELQYLRVEPTSEVLVGNSDHRSPEYVNDPDSFQSRADTDFVEMAVGKLMRRFPGLDEAGLKSTYAGIYDVTPDFNPVIDLDDDRLLLACGFSGHGFKIAPAVGELVADLVIHGASQHPHVPTDEFRLARFDEGAPLASEHPYRTAGQMR